MEKTAKYKIISDSGGNRYRFFCELSGAHLCTTKPYSEAHPGEKLELAWEQEGRPNFNLCHKCGKWVSSVMYNADVLECVECAPWEGEAQYCPHCGKAVRRPGRFCSHCKKLLRYEGMQMDTQNDDQPAEKAGNKNLNGGTT